MYVLCTYIMHLQTIAYNIIAHEQPKQIANYGDGGVGHIVQWPNDERGHNTRNSYILAIHCLATVSKNTHVQCHVQLVN